MYTFYSGGAEGADTVWAKALRQAGHAVKEYRPADYANLNSTWKDIISKQYIEVCQLIHRTILSDQTFSGQLVRRDMMQADKASEVFAVAELKYGRIEGGTAYAVTRALVIGKKVTLYNQLDNKWYVNETGIHGQFVPCWYEPVLCDKAAVVGTRQITPEGVEAIVDIVNRSFK